MTDHLEYFPLPPTSPHRLSLVPLQSLLNAQQAYELQDRLGGGGLRLKMEELMCGQLPDALLMAALVSLLHWLASWARPWEAARHIQV